MDPGLLLNTPMAGELTGKVAMDESLVIPETEIETERGTLDVESIVTESMIARRTMTETEIMIAIEIMIGGTVTETTVVVDMVVEVAVVVVVAVAAVDTVLLTTLSFVSLLVGCLKVVLGKISKITSDK